MTKTTNYQLPQWETTDPVRREDFNAAMENIEEGLTATREKTDIETGTILLSADVSGTIVKAFSFQPRVLILSASSVTTGALIPNSSAIIRSQSNSNNSCQLTLSGSNLWLSVFSNGPSKVNYMAFR